MIILMMVSQWCFLEAAVVRTQCRCNKDRRCGYLVTERIVSAEEGIFWILDFFSPATGDRWINALIKTNNHKQKAFNYGL